jgi:hypothetical protein
MSSITRSPAVKKIALSIAGKPLMKKLDNASKDIKASQQRVLDGILGASKETVFGQEHKLALVRNAADFARAVPIRDFEGHRGYIDRMCRGEKNILFPGKPLFYNTTSGTTDKPKLIPVSKEYYERAYAGISRLWFYTCLRDNPKLFNGQNLSAVAPAVEGTVEDGTPYGSISGVVYKNIPGILKDLYSTPYPVICIRDYQKKYYAMMRYGLGTAISYIITVNPSTLLQFHRTVLDNAQDLVKDIRDGTLRSDVAAEIDRREREAMLKQLRPNPARARELEKLIGMHGKDLRPRHYWPDMVCINTWKQGNCALILPKLEGFYPVSTVYREFGYQASEARAGLVLGNEWDYSVLLAHIYYFEFIEEHRRNDANPPVLGAHQLEIGKSYYLLFTNGSGLYRYDINDLVRVTGFYGEFPLFEFLQKGEGVTSLTGEKISEQQVMKAVDEACRARGCKVEFYTMFCDEKAFCYSLFVEFGSGFSGHTKRSFLQSVDAHLKFMNPEYTAKRGSNRLREPVLVELVPNAYERLKQLLLERGLVREGQYKVSCLRKEQDMLAAYKELTIKTTD